MLNSSPRPDLPRPALRLFAAICLTLASAVGLGQTLARPGWMNSTVNADWWRTAVFFDIRALGGDYPDFKAIAAHLDAIQLTGADALIVPAPKLPVQPAHTAAAASEAPTAAPSDTGLDDFDDLVHEASRRNMHVLLNLAPYDPSGEVFTLAAAARYWLTHGIAGFRLIEPQAASAQDKQTMVQQLRTAANGALGQRIVVASFDASQPAAPASSQVFSVHGTGRGRGSSAAKIIGTLPIDRPHLQIDSRLGLVEAPQAGALRAAVLQTLAQPNLVLDLHPPAAQLSAPPSPLGKVMAALLLTTHSAGMIDADRVSGLSANVATQPEVPSAGITDRPAQPKPLASRIPSLPDWYRELSALHHGNPAFRTGNISFLDFDSQNALVWVARQPGASQSLLNPPIVVVCNLSASPIQLSLIAAIKGLDLRGSFLRTLLRTDDGMGPQDLNSVNLPPYSVYIGELKR